MMKKDEESVLRERSELVLHNSSFCIHHWPWKEPVMSAGTEFEEAREPFLHVLGLHVSRLENDPGAAVGFGANDGSDGADVGEMEEGGVAHLRCAFPEFGVRNGEGGGEFLLQGRETRGRKLVVR